jgi:hypothetical protein
MKKKSRRELAREIIANLRLGMNRQPKNPTEQAERKDIPAAVPFTPMPFVRSARPRPLQTSHSHS